MLYYVMAHTVGVCKTIHITKHDHMDVTKPTHFKNTCEKMPKNIVLQCFCKDHCSYYYVIKTSPKTSLGLTYWSMSVQSNVVQVWSSLQSFAVHLDWTSKHYSLLVNQL